MAKTSCTCVALGENFANPDTTNATAMAIPAGCHIDGDTDAATPYLCTFE